MKKYVTDKIKELGLDPLRNGHYISIEVNDYIISYNTIGGYWYVLDTPIRGKGFIGFQEFYEKHKSKTLKQLNKI